MNTIERILKLIKEKGISEKQFYDDLGLGKDKLSEWKKGKTESYMKFIPQISDYFKVSTDYLLCKTDDPAPPNKEDKEEDNGLVIIRRLRKRLPPSDNERMVNVIKAMFDESFPKDKDDDKQE